MLAYNVCIKENPQAVNSPHPALSPPPKKNKKTTTTQMLYWSFQLRGQPFDFWGGYGWFQKKNRLQTDFKGIKSLAREYLAKKYPALKRNISCCIILEKNLLLLCVGEKNYFSRGFGKKISYPNQITHTPSPLKKIYPLNISNRHCLITVQLILSILFLLSVI